MVFKWGWGREGDRQPREYKKTQKSKKYFSERQDFASLNQEIIQSSMKDLKDKFKEISQKVKYKDREIEKIID